MTLYQAALEVLRSFSRPLHYKKIAELARRQSLLEDAQSQREDLADAMRAALDQHSDDVVCPRPGVFALKDWAEPVTDSSAPAAKAAPAQASSQDDDDDEDSGRGRRRRRRRRRQPEQDAAPSESSSPRRRRRQRGSVPEDATSSPETASTTPNDPPVEPTPPAASHEVPQRKTAASAEQSRTQDPAETAESGSRRRRRRRRRGDEEPQPTAKAVSAETAPSKKAAPEPAPVAQAAPAPEPDTGDTQLAGEALADAVASLLEQEDQPRTAQALATTLNTKRRSKGLSAEGVVAALVTSDSARLAHGQRPRFAKLTHRHWGRSLGSVDAQSRAIETAINKHAATLHQHTQSQLHTLLQQLPHAAVVELVLHWLERLNHQVDDVRRHDNGDTTVVAYARTGLGKRTLAVRVVAASGELTRDAVTDLRGTLHHFNAAHGWLITQHTVTADAIEEAMTANLAMITLFDGAHFAQAMLDAGLGVQQTAVPLSFVDLDFFNTLKGQQSE